MAKARSLLHESVRPLPLVAGFFKALTRSRGHLIAENAPLRQQLIVAFRKVKRPAFKDSERGLLGLLSRIRSWLAVCCPVGKARDHLG